MKNQSKYYVAKDFLVYFGIQYNYEHNSKSQFNSSTYVIKLNGVLMSPLVSLVTSLALLLFLVITINVGKARAKYGVKPPEIFGNPDFERVLRVQQNTLEQLILFLPALWTFSTFVSPIAASVLGCVWIFGRAIYALGYYQAAEKRVPGFGISILSTTILLLGSIVGITLQLVGGRF